MVEQDSLKVLAVGSSPTASATVLIAVYEPKFRLNKVDQLRWLQLVAREAVEAGPPRKEFPPLNLKECVELERLARKQRRKINSHPKMKEILRQGRKQMRHLDTLSRRLDALLELIKKHEA